MAKYTKTELREGAERAADMLEAYAKVCDVESRKTGIQRSDQIQWTDEAEIARNIAEQQRYLATYLLKPDTAKDTTKKKATSKSSD